MVRNADFLTDGPETACYDFVAGNPPYLRAQRIPDVLRRQYEAVTPAYARADMLHSFMDRCARTLKPDGEIALVTADRWLFNMNAAGLRASLGERFGIHHLERLDASTAFRSEEHTSELQSLMRISYAVFCLKKKNKEQ